MLLGGTSRPGNWRGERKQAGVAGCGWLMTKHGAQPAGRQDRIWVRYCNKAEGLGRRQFRERHGQEGRPFSRRAYRGDTLRSDDAVFLAMGGGGRRCWLLLAVGSAVKVKVRGQASYSFEFFVQATNHIRTRARRRKDGRAGLGGGEGGLVLAVNRPSE
jgi:hypothetical protein